MSADTPASPDSETPAPPESGLTRDEVAHLARLARLAVTDAELDVFAGQLDVILGSVARVGEVAADDIPPTSHAVPLENVFRPDERRPGLTQEQALSGAPAAEDGRVPRSPQILGGGGMSDLTRMTAAELAGQIHSREVSAVEVAQAHLDRIAAVDAEVHAFLHVAAEAALESAALVDARLDAGTEPRSPLAGVPLALKDVLTTTDMPTTVGSRILEGWRPPYDATVTARLRAAGITILGKTNMDEFAMGSSTEYSAYGVTHNPWDTARIPGGSGGGSAAALAAFEAPLAIGTDTGGSIRQPAAMTGTVGVKPTYGGVSRYGLIACASSLDQAGPCARTVLDAALLHEVIAGYDPLDSTSIDAPVPAVVDAARRGRRRRPVRPARRRGPRAGRRGLPGGRARAPTSGRGAAGEAGRRAGRGELPALRVRAGRVLPDPAERGVVQPRPVRRHALRPARRRRGQRRGGHGGHPRGRVRPRGQAAHHPRHLRAVVGLLRRLLRAGAEGAHADQRATSPRRSPRPTCWSRPTAPTTAFPIGDKVDDPLAMYLNDLATIPTNLAGTAALSVPSGLADEDGLPVGLQIMAPALGEAVMYRVGGGVRGRPRRRRRRAADPARAGAGGARMT